jgi:hypothetical protein
MRYVAVPSLRSQYAIPFSSNFPPCMQPAISILYLPKRGSSISSVTDVHISHHRILYILISCYHLILENPISHLPAVRLKNFSHSSFSVRDTYPPLSYSLIWYYNKFGDKKIHLIQNFSSCRLIFFIECTCVACGSHKKQQSFPFTVLTEWFL